MTDTSVTDRSRPRRAVNAGDATIDRRGRELSAPAFLSYGFRPFFLGGAVHAALAVPLWLWIHEGRAEPAGPFSGMAWHVHEMLFGYLGAVMAGFILTAVPNWTGRLPLSGAPLAVLFALWIAGRMASSFVAQPIAALLVDLAFPVALAASVWREVFAGRNFRNVPIALLLSFFALANLLHHWEQTSPEWSGAAARLALGAAIMLIALIGGRVTPSFTRNWLARQGEARLPASPDSIDRTALAATLAAVVAWNAAPTHDVTGGLMLAAGVMLFVRLSRWRGASTLAEPIVAVLHLGYLWLAVALGLLGLGILAPGIVPPSAALHALTAGAIATMTLAIMTRASRGHTGRAIETDLTTIAIYFLVTAGALARVAAPFLAALYEPFLVMGGALWSLAFALFALRYGPMLVTRRR